MYNLQLPAMLEGIVKESRYLHLMKETAVVWNRKTPTLLFLVLEDVSTGKYILTHVP